MVVIIDPSWLQTKSQNLCINSKTKAHRQGNCSKKIASEALKDPKIKNYVVEMIGRELAKEVKVISWA